MRPTPFTSRTLTIRVLFAFAIAALVGCSQSPTAPLISRPAADMASVSPSNGQNPAPSVGGRTAVDPPSPSPGAESSVWVSPARGGTVAAGQFRVVIPPEALRQRALVTVRQPHLDERVVELELTPASANGFSDPVQLVVQCSDMDVKLLSQQTIWWWNPGPQRWEAMQNVQINLNARTLSTQLSHFSKYKVGGKAGW